MNQPQGNRQAIQPEPESLYELWQAWSLSISEDLLMGIGLFSILGCALFFGLGYGQDLNSDIQVPYLIMMACQWLLWLTAIVCVASWAMHFEHTLRREGEKRRAELDAQASKDRRIAELERDLAACHSQCQDDPGKGRGGNNPRMPLPGHQYSRR